MKNLKNREAQYLLRRKLLFFQNYMVHYTTEHKIEDERITLAMDIFTEGAYNDPSEKQYAERCVRFL
jgi:hypothetical protein